MPLQMSFWGREENKEAVLDQLKMHGFKLAPPLKGNFSSLGFFSVLAHWTCYWLEEAFKGLILMIVSSFTKLFF